MRRFWISILLIVLVLIVPAILDNRRTPYQVSPTPQPSKTYSVYLPIIMVRFPQAHYSDKKGLGGARSCADHEALGTSWSYGWTTEPLNCPEAPGVSMIWGRDQIGQPLTGASPFALLFNEPDLSGQSNISVTEAVTLSHQVFELYPDKLWISPAASHLHPGWLTQWYDAYKLEYGVPPPIVGIAIHCYWDGQACVDYTKSHVNIAKSWGLSSVWITEFAFGACRDKSINQTLDETRLYLDYLETEPLVTNYAWFIAYYPGGDEWWMPPWECRAPLLRDAGTQTPWGEVYAGR